MPSTYQTPGVYIEEVATLPASVVQVPTAIPGFIGVTADRPDDLGHFCKVSSLIEYEHLFGRVVTATADFDFYTYSSIKLFFANGGGEAYVYSVGKDKSGLDKDKFTTAIKDLEKQPEITLVLFPDAVSLVMNDFYEVQNAALTACQASANRFCILDVFDEDYLIGTGHVAEIRTKITFPPGDPKLSYGAVYGPWLQISVPASPPAPAPSAKPKKAVTDSATKPGAEPGVIPASGAVAGIYASVDSQRGVWKAPANAGLTGIIGLSETVSDTEQELLNVDSNSGKSINVVRTFPGKGTLVWGARTLAGNDNEWKFIPVRRLFIMAEESIRRSTAFAVFEPNDANTWMKLKAMVENFLSDLWRQGALAGAKPEQAFFVNVGLGSTMTPQDILEGRLIINVGMAAVRPSEFIVIRFSHKLQQA